MQLEVSATTSSGFPYKEHYSVTPFTVAMTLYWRGLHRQLWVQICIGAIREGLVHRRCIIRFRIDDLYSIAASIQLVRYDHDSHVAFRGIEVQYLVV